MVAVTGVLPRHLQELYPPRNKQTLLMRLWWLPHHVGEDRKTQGNLHSLNGRKMASCGKG